MAWMFVMKNDNTPSENNAHCLCIVYDSWVVVVANTAAADDNENKNIEYGIWKSESIMYFNKPRQAASLWVFISKADDEKDDTVALQLSTDWFVYYIPYGGSNGT